MPLAAGTRLGSYEILAPLGEGGMGEVYRAIDTKLDRQVAIKVIPEALARDPDRLARFEREAKVLASLNHPNIAQIYGIEERALVMELVPGGTLTSPQPLNTALNYARQIADALEAAHEKGITHRDLKPGNVMVTPEGVVKVLDFGLAAVAQPSDQSGIDRQTSPTLTMRPNEAGVVMGTTAYMSPEQASGKPVDKRADIWSFGVVLWEMLTGAQLFEGETIPHTLADVLRGPIDLDRLPKETPPAIRNLLRRCLDRDLRTRLRDIGEARIAIQSHLANPTGVPEAPRVIVISKRGHKWKFIAATLALATLGLGYIAFRHTTEPVPEVVKFELLPPENTRFSGGIPSISPDGRHVVFQASREASGSLWVRDLDSLSARALPGTEGGSQPFWSPDSRLIAFFSRDQLKTVDLAGGPAVTICQKLGPARGASWTHDTKDTILFSSFGGGLFQVPASGGTPESVMKPEGPNEFYLWPSFLPDGHHFLFYSGGNQPGLHVGDIQTGKQQIVMPVASNGVFANGSLLFVRNRTLLAQSFDLDKLQVTGPAVPIAESVGSGIMDAEYQFSASQNGKLVYRTGAGLEVQLTWVDRSGAAVGTVGPVTTIDTWPVISPDGSTVAVSRPESDNASDLWLYGITRGTASRFTFGPQRNSHPIWSPDGSRIAFASSRDGLIHVFQRSLDKEQDEVLGMPAGDPPTSTFPDDWSPDGRYLVERVLQPGGSQLWILPLFGDRKPYPYLQAQHLANLSKISPNGRWLAYMSRESNTNEVYVQSFPRPGSKVQISSHGGAKPAWSRDGKELFYIARGGRMMAVPVHPDGVKFEAGEPKELFDTNMLGSFEVRFDVAKDGRFLIPVQVGQSANSSLTVIVNWPVGLKK